MIHNIPEKKVFKPFLYPQEKELIRALEAQKRPFFELLTKKISSKISTVVNCFLIISLKYLNHANTLIIVLFKIIS